MENVRDLEKNYFQDIEQIISSKSFIQNLREIENFIQNNYELLKEHWQEKNKLKIPVERLLRFNFYTKMNPLYTFNSVLSSDIAFYMDNILLNIDAKTIDMYNNSGDFSYPAIVLKNQITFKNKNLFMDKYTIGTRKWKGVPFPPMLKPFTIHPIAGKEVPTLTYFIKFSYYDDNNSFELEDYALTCIPHYDLSSNFNYDIIQNFKSYNYDRKVSTLTDKEIKEKNWKKEKIHNKIWYFNPSNLEAWSKVDKKWRKVISGGSARIKKEDQFIGGCGETIKRRLDSNDELWEGYKIFSYKTLNNNDPL